ncbi:MAG: PASTA domain-containing protein [Clostridiales bacterium]|jgi:stage V sporulation protein D (sporulation-specific penicillin-binding protein)|nr:PASTA domain-containing protein [Clostridiales bacterium]
MVCETALVFMLFRVFYIQAFRAEELQAKAYEQQTRDRLITADRGSIYDRNMQPLAVTETVCSVSVIRAQIEDSELVARTLSEMLDLNYDDVLKKCKKFVALERIKTKVDKELADKIRALDIPGIIVDEDIKRSYPNDALAAQVIGFVGKDNQGIIGLEAKYEKVLSGESGKILTETDASGIELETGEIVRIPPKTGSSLVVTLDTLVQKYAEQAIKKAVEAKQAKRGLIVVMNPQNGEIYAIANEPSFDLNDPFTINDPALAEIWETFTSEQQMNYLNNMWRNFALNDTYEPGSTFKILTSAAGLETGTVNLGSRFVCSGGVTVGGRYIKCWRSPRSHGAESFVEGVQNSCNPVFMEIADKMGAETFYNYLLKFGLKQKTGVDLPGEAVGIMHPLTKVGPVELATMSFGQSLQITPLRLLTAVSATINGGYLITPHVGKAAVDENGQIVETFAYEKGEQVISAKTSDDMKEVLESVVSVGTGNRAYVPGYRIGGKTATSEKLPRRSGKYIASFLSFAPAENPSVIALVLIDEPQGTYYGGQVAGPVMKELLQNILPYLGIEPVYSEKELETDGVGEVTVPDFFGQDRETIRKTADTLKLEIEFTGKGKAVSQFPPEGETVNQKSKITIQLQ